MILQLPRLRVIALCGAAACACASWLGAYFGEAYGGAAAFIGCWLLFVAALSLRPARREVLGGAVLAAIFAAMRTLGVSYDSIDSYGMIFKNTRTLVTAFLAMVSLLAVALCCILLAFTLLARVRLRACGGQQDDPCAQRRLFWLCALVIFAGSIPYLILYAPGLNIYDTHDQILQFFGYPSYIGDGSALSDHHPVFLTLVYGAFMQLGLLMGDANIGQLLYSLVSMAALALCWAHALCLLCHLGLRRGAAMGIAFFVALYPVLALYAFNMCKDVSVEPFVLLFAAQMVLLDRTNGEAAKSPRFLAELALCALAMMLTRKSAVYALAFAGLFAVLRFKGVRMRLGAALLGTAVAFQGIYSGFLLPMLGVIPGETREMLSIPFQQTARYLVTHGEDITEEERLALSRVIDIEHAVAHYDPRLSDAVKDTTNPDMTADDLAAYFGAWLSMGLRHPGVYMDAWLNMIYGYFYPSDSNTIVCLTLNSPDQGGIWLTQDSALEDKRLELYNFITYLLRRLPGVGALFYVDAVTWAFLFLLIALMLRDGLRACVPWMFFVGTLGICMLSPKSGEIRYVLPILYALPVMLGAALLPGAGKEAVPHV